MSMNFFSEEYQSSMIVPLTFRPAHEHRLMGHVHELMLMGLAHELLLVGRAHELNACGPGPRAYEPHGPFQCYIACYTLWQGWNYQSV